MFLATILQAFTIIKVCVYDKQTNEPIESAEIYTPLTFTFTDENGCAPVKIRENDSLIIYRIGYKTLILKGKIENKIYLEGQGISLKTVEVISNSIRVSEVKDIRNELENNNFGIAVNKPIISGFGRDKYNIIVDGAFLNDQSDYIDHPIVVDFDLVDKITISNSQNSAIFGLNSVAGGIDLKLFDIRENRLMVFSDYFSQNSRFSIGLKNIRNYSNFGYKFGIKGSISSDYSEPKVQNTSDTSLYSIFSLKYRDFQVANYFSFINYGIPNLNSRAHNLFLNPRIGFRNLMFDAQISSQSEYERANLVTKLELLTFQAIYNVNKLYLNLSFNSYTGGDMNSYRFLLTILHSNKLKNLFNYAISIIPNYSKFNDKINFGFNFLIEKSVKYFDLSISLSTQEPSLHQLTFTGIHSGVNRYEISNPSLKAENLFDFSIIYRYSINQFAFSIAPSINYIKNFILLIPLDTTIEGLQAYIFRNKDIYILNFSSSFSFIFSKDLNANLRLTYLRPQFEIPFYSKPQIKSNLNYKFFSAYYRAIFSDKIYSIFSIGLNYSVKRLEFRALLDNVFNEFYIEPTNPFSTPSPYRNFSIKLNYSH